MKNYDAQLSDRPSTGRIAVIFTAKDEVGEAAFRSIAGQAGGADIFSTRTVYLDDEPDENGDFHLVTSFDDIAKNFPDTDRLDIFAFSCTSGTVATGKDKMLDILKAARPGLKYSTPGFAALNALKAVKAQSINLLTPYPQYLHDMFLPFFEDEGFRITTHGRFDVKEADIPRISYNAIAQASADLLSTTPCDVLYISCTALDIVSNIEKLEADLGVTVLTSTQVFAWDCLRLLKAKTMPTGFGRLFSCI